MKDKDENLKILSKELNGQADITMKVITKTLQAYDPIKFSEQCQEVFNTFNQEAMICYQVNTSLMQTPQGTALVFIAVWQYWGREEEFKAYEAELKRSNLIIKP